MDNRLLPLPTGNAVLTHRAGDFNSIAEALHYAAQGDTGLSFYDSAGQLSQVITYRELEQAALIISAGLRNCDLVNGQRVAIIGETSADFLKVFYGCQYAGIIPCALPYTIMAGGRDTYFERISELFRAAEASLLCIPKPLAQYRGYWEALGINVVTFQEIEEFGEVFCYEPTLPNSIAYIQFSSGSTAEPKGILISNEALCTNVRAILRELIKITNEDRAFSWLPFYHDMGLVGFSIAPLFSQTSVDYLAPNSFARRPLLWLELMHSNRSTITFSPVFGYRVAAQRLSQSLNKYDLSQLRIAGIGGEMVVAEELRAFEEAAEIHCFDPASFTPSYGLAESTLLFSFRHGIKTIENDLERRESAEFDGSSNCSLRARVVCGRAISGHEVSIWGDDGRPLAEGAIGRICIKGLSLFSGYSSSDCCGDPIVDGWFDTGDMGYLIGGELVVTGRRKELIISNGRNIWPLDVERSVQCLPDFRKSNVAAFSLLDGDAERVVVMIESVTHEVVSDETVALAKSVISTSHGISVEIVFVPKKTLFFTSSGKLSRTIARSYYLSCYAGALKSTLGN